MYPMAPGKKQSKNIAAILNFASRTIYAGRLIRSFMVWLLVFLCFWLCFFLLDNYFHLPAELRLPVSVSSIVIAGYFLIRHVISPFLNRNPAEKIALDIESKFQLKDNILINSLQFETRNSMHGKFRLKQFEKPFAETTIAEALSLSRNITPGILKKTKLIRIFSFAVIVVLSCWTAYGITHTRHALNAMSRYVKPLADIPPAGMIEIGVLNGDEIIVAEGDDLEVQINVKTYHAGYQLKKYPEIVWRRDSYYVDATPPGIKTSDLNVRPVNPVDGRADSFTYTFKNVRHDMAFRVFAGDTYSSSVVVKVNKVPCVVKSEFLAALPEYTGGNVDKLNITNNEISVLPNTKISMNITLDKAVDSLQFIYQGKTSLFDGNGKNFTLDFTAGISGSYSIKADYKAIGKIVDVLAGNVVPALDSPPYIEFETDKLSLVAVPGQRLNIPVKLSDDYGLSWFKVTVEKDNSSIEPEVVNSADYEGPPGVKSKKENLLLSLDAHKFQPGSSYIIRAVAADFCPEENLSYSSPLVVSIRSLDDITLAPDDPAIGVFELLDKAIDAQKDALGASQNIIANLDDIVTGDDAAARDNLILHRDSLQGKQAKVGSFLNQAVLSASEPGSDFIDKISEIYRGENTRVLSKIVVLASQRKPDISMTRRSLAGITELQQYILDRLIALKADIALQREQDKNAAAGNQTKAELDKSIYETFDESLDDFVTELDNFVSHQKNITHRRDLIMDKAVEDFTEDDVDNLARLAIDQSRLAEILSSAVNDFTKVDLQDFGDPAMVENLTSIYQAAENLAETADQAADDRMARVDAYRLETELVEMAEEILINCEATMDFYDHIQFIAEVPEDLQLVAPLAELPDELEDLVGDLVTSEEEMAQEVEDIGSYLNSLDHTAGPVSDGTIASTSAKGVTGDQKPEDNIIQGRSGAGRSGMSEGQMVESVAKDLHDNEYSLRERTSNTPLESGDVRDEDVGAQTGGTGLGKMTDQASIFGSGGQLPPKVLQKMRDAKTQQQAITNSARQLIPRLHRHNLSTAELESALENMQTFENELDNPKIGPELRRAYNQTLDSLKKSHHEIGSQVRTRYIQNAAGSTEIDTNQQDQTSKYKGYERVINAYFEALAK